MEHDLSQSKPGKSEFDELISLEGSASFDLEKGPLIRGRLIRIAEDEDVLLITMHHIVADGWSIGVFVNELSALYSAFLRGEPEPLSELELQYADYALWQRDRFGGEGFTEQAEYWRTTLAGVPELLELPTDQPRPARQDLSGAFEELVLPRKLTLGLKALGHRYGTTLFMTLLGGWAALLSRLSGESEVVVGIPVANRGHKEIDSLIGFFFG